MSLPKYLHKGVEMMKDHTALNMKVIKINPFGAQTFSASGTRDITFKLPRNGVLVGTKSHFYFKAEADGDAAADDEFMSDIHTVFDNFRVEVGSQEIINEQEYGWWRNMEFYAHASDSDLSSASSTVMNIPDNSTSGTAKKYRIPLASKWNRNGLFSAPLPLYKLDQVTLEWRINNSLAEYTTATTAVTSVDITDCMLELYIVDGPEIRRMFDQDIVREFETFFYYHSTLPNAATQLSVNIPCSVQNLKGLSMIQRYSVDPIDPNWETGTALENNKYSQSFVTNSLTKFSVSIDGVTYPDSKPIDGTNSVEMVSNLERFWNVDRLGGWFDDDTLDTTDSKGYYALSFNPADDDGVSGVSLVNKSGTIVALADLTAAAATDVDFFLKYSKFIKIDKSGAISVTK